MLSSICWRRPSILPAVKFLSRLFTALNLLPSIATSACENSLSSRQISTKRLHTLRMAGPLSRRKSAIVLKSGARRPHQLDVALTFMLKASAGLDSVEIPVDIDLERHAGMV